MRLNCFRAKGLYLAEVSGAGTLIQRHVSPPPAGLTPPPRTSPGLHSHYRAPQWHARRWGTAHSLERFPVGPLPPHLAFVQWLTSLRTRWTPHHPTLCSLRKDPVISPRNLLGPLGPLRKPRPKHLAEPAILPHTTPEQRPSLSPHQPLLRAPVPAREVAGVHGDNLVPQRLSSRLDSNYCVAGGGPESVSAGHGSDRTYHLPS